MIITFAALHLSRVAHEHLRLIHPLDERVELAGALEGIVREVHGYLAVLLGEIVHGVQVAFKHSDEPVPPQIQEAQVVQARQIEVQRAQCIIAEIEVLDIRQVAEHVNVAEL